MKQVPLGSQGMVCGEMGLGAHCDCSADEGVRVGHCQRVRPRGRCNCAVQRCEAVYSGVECNQIFN